MSVRQHCYIHGRAVNSCTPDCPAEGWTPAQPQAEPSAEWLEKAEGIIARYRDRRVDSLHVSIALALQSLDSARASAEKANAAEHHKLPWHECPTCVRWFQQDENGAAENARLQGLGDTLAQLLQALHLEWGAKVIPQPGCPECDAIKAWSAIRGIHLWRECIPCRKGEDHFDGVAYPCRALPSAPPSVDASVKVAHTETCCPQYADFHCCGGVPAPPATPETPGGFGALRVGEYACVVCRKPFDEVGKRRTCRECRKRYVPAPATAEPAKEK